ncbi:zinc-binding alcohol dehydrogenase family protein [Shewanella yunxiaonensis]|uniref:Zinc-type alcohol dehydrogenase-like protein n=1 Tax=Shewanella yunxiaonensis TaxID=2829809 RepID=A0ABX7YUQ6_9GAMM|nr:zinc-binding alcohol dehydrogenase family protein [Shewanella yunxiaonensis]QUN06510.1 zinc-binding alcohol dehydrogenase family protein [Shewanella yunxiaonensis]
MKAVGYKQAHTLGGDDVLQDIELPQLTAKGQDLLVAVQAISVNPVDTKIRSRVGGENGQYKILGWDAVGTVLQVGDQVSAFNVGDRVWYAGDVSRPGSNAEQQLVDERIVGLAPNNLPDAAAAALPLTALTAWELLFDRLGLPIGAGQGKALLVVGAAGGVGSILVQLARQLTDVTIIATAGRPESKAWLTSLGAHHVIDHHGSLSQQIQAVGFAGVHWVASLNNTDEHIEQIVESLLPQGHLGLIDDPHVFDIKLLKRKSLALHWEFMYTRSLFKTEDMVRQQQILNEVAKLVEAGTLKTTVSEHFGVINATNLLRAHALLESHQARGKIVLEGF